MLRAPPPTGVSAASRALCWAPVIGCPLSSVPWSGVAALSTTTLDTVTEPPSDRTAPNAPTGSPRASTKASGSSLCGTPPGIGPAPPPGGFEARMAMVCSWSSSLPYM